MGIFTNLLSMLGSNTLVSASIPSLALILACILVFDPILQTSNLFQQANGVDILAGFGILIAFPTIILSFTLIALNTYILKLFEGYMLINRFSFMREAHVKQATKLMQRRETLKRRIEVVEQSNNKSERKKNLLLRLRQRYYSVAALYDQSYPPSLNEIMPTKIGNILKASETYAGTRYGMDSVTFWPRLIHVIPSEYKEAIDAARNEVSFLVNFAILAVAFFLLCVFAIIYYFASPSNALLPSNFYFNNSFRYIVAGLIALWCNWLFTRASLYSAGSFGYLIRSAYDLFRLDLLEQFRLKIPSNSIDEFYIWKNLTELLTLGQHSIEFEPLDYDIKAIKKVKKSVKEEHE